MTRDYILAKFALKSDLHYVLPNKVPLCSISSTENNLMHCIVNYTLFIPIIILVHVALNQWSINVYDKRQDSKYFKVADDTVPV